MTRLIVAAQLGLTVAGLFCRLASSAFDVAACRLHSLAELGDADQREALAEDDA